MNFKPFWVPTASLHCIFCDFLLWYWPASRAWIGRWLMVLIGHSEDWKSQYCVVCIQFKTASTKKRVKIPEAINAEFHGTVLFVPPLLIKGPFRCMIWVFNKTGSRTLAGHNRGFFNFFPSYISLTKQWRMAGLDGEEESGGAGYRA